MAKHLWILGRLLTMKIPIEDSRGAKSRNEHILNHVIATCYLKIFGQLQNKNLSLPYITSLKEEMTFQFDKSKLDQGQVSITEMEHDRQFLLDFLLPAIAVFIISMPNLLKQKDTANDDTSFLLYTKDTCNEFHLYYWLSSWDASTHLCFI